jgi:hypothetical protein
MITDVFKSESGIIILSILLGFGLATALKKACTGNNCVIVKGPSIKEIRDTFYRIDDECYKYTPYVTKCV